MAHFGYEIVFFFHVNPGPTGIRALNLQPKVPHVPITPGVRFSEVKPGQAHLVLGWATT